MRFFVDECLSPQIARRLVDFGHDAVHPRDVGRLGDPDHIVLRRAIREDRIMITENARDFLALLRAVDLHPGLTVVPNVGREEAWRLVVGAVGHLEATSGGLRPEDGMVNRVLDVGRDGALEIRTYPPT